MYGGAGNDTYVTTAGDRIFELKSQGTDTLKSAASATLSLNVEVLALVGSGNLAATGNAGANTLFIGNAGKNTLSGLAGNDVLVGGLGRDTMTGGAQRDIFVFNAVSETGKTSSTRDKITDFTHGSDDVDLKTIDANGSASGNGTFKFVAKEGSVFTGVRGQLIWDQQDTSGTANDRTIVSGDTNGDKHADFQIELTGSRR